MTRELVLVHGRSQQLKDPDKLKADWLDALDKGLQKSGLKLPIPHTSVRFPFYGDTLIALMDGKSPEEAAKVVIRGEVQDAEKRSFIQEVVEEVRTETKITTEDVAETASPEVAERGWKNWEWVQAVAEVIDDKVPGASSMTIALATNDVYEYLVAQSTKDEIDEGVSKAFTSGVEMVVVAHSLGTVVAYNLLRNMGEVEDWVVPQFVTVGSPLGVNRIRSEIRSPRWPACVDAWFNGMDERDIVSLYPLDPDHFGVGRDRKIINKTDVDNHTKNRHGISGYLDDAEIAKVIYDALTAE